jgi:hypothetical protein
VAPGGAWSSARPRAARASSSPPPRATSWVGRRAATSPVFLETDDFAAQHARMLSHGVVFREEPRHEPYGTVAVFEDLHGMPWDLIQPPTPG